MSYGTEWPIENGDFPQAGGEMTDLRAAIHEKNDLASIADLFGGANPTAPQDVTGQYLAWIHDRLDGTEGDPGYQNAIETQFADANWVLDYGDNFNRLVTGTPGGYESNVFAECWTTPTTWRVTETDFVQTGHPNDCRAVVDQMARLATIQFDLDVSTVAYGNGTHPTDFAIARDAAFGFGGTEWFPPVAVYPALGTMGISMPVGGQNATVLCIVSVQGTVQTPLIFDAGFSELTRVWLVFERLLLYDGDVKVHFLYNVIVNGVTLRTISTDPAVSPPDGTYRFPGKPGGTIGLPYSAPAYRVDITAQVTADPETDTVVEFEIDYNHVNDADKASWTGQFRFCKCLQDPADIHGGDEHHWQMYLVVQPAWGYAPTWTQPGWMQGAI